MHRIHTKIVLAPDGLVEQDDFYWSNEPIAELKGGGGSTTVVEAPKPSAEELALQRKQTEILDQQLQIIKGQYEEQKLISPLLFKNAGLEPVLDEAGKITSFREIPDPYKEQRKEIEGEFLKRSSAALKGELPVAPQLLRDLDQAESVLHETLRKNLGPGYETSSGGIQALSQFGERKLGLLEAARRDDLTLAEQLGIAREMTNQDKIARFLSQATGINQNPLTMGQAFGQSAAGYGAAQQPYQSQRQMQFQADIANAQNASRGRSGGLLGSIFGGIGSGVGSGIGSVVASTMFSDRKVKKNIKRIGTLDNGLPVYSFNYIWGGPTQIGVLAQDVEKVNPEAVGNVDGIKTVDYTKAAA